MRIIAGEAKGRKLKAPAHGTRPMTGRAKESLFSMLGDAVAGARVLDLYAGSGSLGLEALSRGAAHAVFVERDREAAEIVRTNIASVGAVGDVVQADVASFLGRGDAEFDLVFVDPPYADPDEVVASVLALLEPHLAADGIVVVHREQSVVAGVPEFLTCFKQRRYGSACVALYQKEQA